MLQKREIRKSLVLFLCFTILLYINPLAPTTIVAWGNEVEPTERENDPEQTGNNGIVVLQNVEEQQVITINPLGGSFFNELILVTGEVESVVGAEEKLTLIVSDNGSFSKELTRTIQLVDGAWEHSFDVSEKVNGNFIFPEGEYTIKATVTGSELLISNDVTFKVDRTVPTVEISRPLQNGEYVNKALIEGSTEIGNTVDLYHVIGEVEKKIHSVVANDHGVFSFLLNDLVEGDHTFIIKVTNYAGNVGETKEFSFIYDKTRPYVSTANLTPKHNSTGIDFNSKITLKLVDPNLDINNILTKDPIELYERGNSTKIPGKVTYDEATKILTFTPNNNLKASTKYFVVINPKITDMAGNLIHQRNWSFTTKNNSGVGSPHGGYLENTNTCKLCHSTHMASQPKMQQGNLELIDDPNNLIDPSNIPNVINGYCMACHDGTVASNMNNHQGKKSDHNKQVVRKADGAVVSQSCGNCHNVHLESHASNPNLLKDHFVFDHTGVKDADGVGKIDSSERLCESCHEYDLGEKLNANQYAVYTYRNRNTSSSDLKDKNHYGSADDYQLCLRCHNSDYAAKYKGVNKAIADIEKFYKNTNSGHYILMDKVKDGSLLNGNMPCADCHETHNANNGKLIKKDLGHNTESSTILENWPNAGVNANLNQRTLCLSCHNNETELYGITVGLPEKNASGSTINAHLPTSTSACSNCHGGSSRTFMEAVHSPSKRGN
ncbi:Ig-like domain-containing protein [Anaerobacillus sp. CMMVII]|uniref:Ig-like domain-containing protein n=1 Tax=Anaerobacillus sp. CMMVII TaxID=2755588 RepID=UPI0021B7AFE8|nr:Ig-like domain-containing protein [Anaerobacillus sp. CMMVII]MCT8137716.1 Ig-like domain-containing protein [Anaerobacillus sp. CMMVII]